MSEMPNRRPPLGQQDADGGPHASATLATPQKPCRACGGSGVVVCKACDASGVSLIDL